MGEGIAKLEDGDDVFNVGAKHFATFMDRIATDLGVETDQIVDFEFCAYDAHPPAIIGLHQEFVSSPRLDNLASSLSSLDSLIEHKN